MTEDVRPLGLVSAVLAGMGLEVTYVYDDLVFVSHNAFMFQFEDKAGAVRLYFNVDCPEEEAAGILDRLVSSGRGKGLTISPQGRYELGQNQDESMSLRFIPATGE
jgi:hypothetical protein